MISTNLKKTFNQIHHPFLLRTLNKIRIDEQFPNTQAKIQYWAGRGNIRNILTEGRNKK